MPVPPKREPMSEGERRIIQRLRKRWEERHAVWSDEMDNGLTDTPVRYVYWGHRIGRGPLALHDATDVRP
jgi:hypothetical protein